MRIVAILALAAAMGAAAPTHAGPVQYSCVFPSSCEWKRGCHQDESIVMRFVYDEMTKDAFVAGNSGTANVEFIQGNRAITFLEVLPSGAVQSTTLEEGGAAVHSRHTLLTKGLFPSQSYGSCARVGEVK